MICPNCQREVPDTAKACGYCGHWLAVDKPQIKKSTLWPWLVAGGAGVILLLAAGIIAGVSLLSGGGDTTSPDAAGVEPTEQVEIAAMAPTDKPARQSPPTATPEPATSTPTSTTAPPTRVPKREAEVFVLAAPLYAEPDLSAPDLAKLLGKTKVELLAVSPDKQWVEVKARHNNQLLQGWMRVETLELNVSLDELEVKAVALSPTRTPTPTRTPRPTNTPRPTPTPTPTIDADPLVYDNFQNPANDGKWNTGRWEYWSNPGVTTAKQQNGILILSRQTRDNGGLNRRNARIKDLGFFEARVMLDGNIAASAGSVGTGLWGADISNWWLGCTIYAQKGDSNAWAGCTTGDSLDVVRGFQVPFNTWHTLRLEINPDTALISFFIDDQYVGEYIYPNPEKFKNARFDASLQVWSEDGGLVTGYIDNVRMGQFTPSQAAQSPPPATATPVPEQAGAPAGFEVPPGKALFVFYNYTDADWVIDFSPYTLPVPANQPGQPYAVATLAIDPGHYAWSGHSPGGGYYITDANRNQSFEFDVVAGQIFEASVR